MVVSVTVVFPVSCLNTSADKVVVEHDTYRYWTHVEAYPMHVDPLVVIPTARACFLDAITFVFNGELDWSYLHTTRPYGVFSTHL